MHFSTSCLFTCLHLIESFHLQGRNNSFSVQCFFKIFSTETGVAAAGKPAAAHLLIRWQLVWSGIFSDLR